MNTQDGAELVYRTWQVPLELAQAVTQLADGLQVPHSAVVRVLLRHALADTVTGRLDLQARPRRWELIETARGER